jgi:hypothetical protein
VGVTASFPLFIEQILYFIYNLMRLFINKEEACSKKQVCVCNSYSESKNGFTVLFFPENYHLQCNLQYNSLNVKKILRCNLLGDYVAESATFFLIR